MFNISRLKLPKQSKEIRDELMQQTLQFVTSHSTPLQVIFFGSITTENFDEASDIDLLLIYKTQQDADQGRRRLYRSMQPEKIGHPLEMICVDEKTFLEKSKIGGICFIAENEGIPFKNPWELNN